MNLLWGRRIPQAFIAGGDSERDIVYLELPDGSSCSAHIARDLYDSEVGDKIAVLLGDIVAIKGVGFHLRSAEVVLDLKDHE